MEVPVLLQLTGAPENGAHPEHWPPSPGNPWRGGPFRVYGDAVTTQVIVLNGGSSSGKSGIAR
ncbi:hypothetical protein ACFVJ9_48855, partial [Streptomyces sp. NPDC127574]